MVKCVTNYEMAGNQSAAVGKSPGQMADWGTLNGV